MKLTEVQYRVLKSLGALPPKRNYILSRSLRSIEVQKGKEREIERLAELHALHDKIQCLEHPEWGFLTADELFEETGVKPEFIRKHARESRPTRSRINKEWLRFVLHGRKWEGPIPRERVDGKNPYINTPVSKPVRCIETGEIYLSVQEAAAKMGVCRSAILWALKQGTLSANRHWELVIDGTSVQPRNLSQTPRRSDVPVDGKPQSGLPARSPEHMDPTSEHFDPPGTYYA